MKLNKKVLKYFLASLFIITLDQTTKIYTYFNIEVGSVGEIVIIKNLLKIHHVKNPGIAFGIKIKHKYGRAFMIVIKTIIVLIMIYLFKKEKNMVKKKGIFLIINGAISNMIDNIFHNMILKKYYDLNSFFNGEVIDMIYIDIWKGNIFSYIPVIGNSFIYIFPIFNIADIFISIGFLILVFKKN